MEVSRPVVSVVVPTKNRPGLLPVTLQTVLAQRGVDVEVVLVDDGSEPAVTIPPAPAGRAKVRLVRHDRSVGMAGARNAGVAAARGQWLSFCDDDDLWAPMKLSRQLEAAQRAHRMWAYTGVVHVDDALKVIFGLPPPSPELAVRDLVRWDTIPAGASNVLVRHDVLEDVGGWHEGLIHTADWDLWLTLAERGLPACANAPLVAYRQHSTNMSLQAAQLHRELGALEQRHDMDIDEAAFRRWVAEQYLRAGRELPALGWLLRAVGARPRAAELLTAGRMLGAHAKTRLGRGGSHAARSRSDWWTDAEQWLGDVQAIRP